MLLAADMAAADADSPRTVPRQSLDDAWWTGPIVAASAGTLPRGHFLVEPYIFDVITHSRYDGAGRQRSTAHTETFGSLTYVLYGLTDQITVGMIPQFGFNELSAGADSAGIRWGDLTLQGQYRLTQFREGGRLPTISLVLQETLPTGKHDRLGARPGDGFGSGAYTTTLAVYSQYYFWLPNGRILRTRFNVSHSFSDRARVTGVSVYGTDDGFRGRAQPGDSLSINTAAEYSITRNWVLALDVFYQHNARTRVRGASTDAASGEVRAIDASSGSSWRLGIAPAIEYNWSSTLGVIIGARWFAAGRNTDASITPVAAVNMVF